MDRRRQNKSRKEVVTITLALLKFHKVSSSHDVFNSKICCWAQRAQTNDANKICCKSFDSHHQFCLIVIFCQIDPVERESVGRRSIPSINTLSFNKLTGFSKREGQHYYT
mmetsp:Transcript_14567/g.29157  ORF Transcript_14567/g.29157 Transcript_14567/m.29157 type:complete len:110 (-) Transcript_14567:7-336(-)